MKWFKEQMKNNDEMRKKWVLRAVDKKYCNCNEEWFKEELENLRIWYNEWRNLGATPQLIQQWQRHGFTAKCRDWIINADATLQPWQNIQNPSYYAWLGDMRGVDSETFRTSSNQRRMEWGREYDNFRNELQNQLIINLNRKENDLQTTYDRWNGHPQHIPWWLENQTKQLQTEIK